MAVKDLPKYVLYIERDFQKVSFEREREREREKER